MEREEFTSFYATSFSRLVGQLYAMTGDRAEAQDAVQEAFVRAWVHRARVDQIAAETGARPGMVKARLARGRAALAPYLRETPAPVHE